MMNSLQKPGKNGATGRNGARKRRLDSVPGMLLLAIYDFLAIHFSYFFSLWLRYEMRYSAIPKRLLYCYGVTISLYALVSLVVFYFAKMYKAMWRFASVYELSHTFIASIATSVAYTLVLVRFFWRMPILYHVGGAFMQFFFLIAIRFSYRLVLYFGNAYKRGDVAGGRVMIIGAGTTGQMILRDINQNRRNSNRVVCMIDDDPDKWGRFIEGIPIVGGRDSILSSVEKYQVDKIYLVIPDASAADKRDILHICSETGCEMKQLPSMRQFVNGDVTVNAMKNVSVEDLLGRDPIRTDMHEVYEFISGKTVLVTGGGGSIGSELCRQIAAHNPRRLILFDIYENNTYDIQRELKTRYPGLDLVTLIGSVRDSRRIFGVMETYHPEIVYHAAAHKHVPLMEDSPCEAIKNNVIGTYKTAYAAMVNGCERFVLISTDKAVNPTNIMGASKRLCEMIIQTFNEKIKEGRIEDIHQLFTHTGATCTAGELNGKVKTEFVAVRFGNVLGSNGSVVPIFKKQIEEGGPVTVTHPDIIRYFMTIPEAVSLVMLAGTYASGGEIFVLDMGSPVKIADLARNLIRLSGFVPDEDIRIEYTGLRPGEKLYEEKLMAEEGLRKTDNDLIHIGCPIPFDTDEFLRQLPELMEAAYMNRNNIKQVVGEIISTYQPVS